MVESLMHSFEQVESESENQSEIESDTLWKQQKAAVQKKKAVKKSPGTAAMMAFTVPDTFVE